MCENCEKFEEIWNGYWQKQITKKRRGKCKNFYNRNCENRFFKIFYYVIGKYVVRIVFKFREFKLHIKSFMKQ